MKANNIEDINEYASGTTVKEQPSGDNYVNGVQVGWTAPAKWWNWLFSAITKRLTEIYTTVSSIHEEIKNAVGGTIDPGSNTQLKGKFDSITGSIGQANGIASLDSNGRIPYSQLPESAIEYKGVWDAATNTPELADGTGTKGDTYFVSVAGTQDLGSGPINFAVNDRVMYNGTIWQKMPAGTVQSVNNVQPVDGNVTLTKSDIGLSNVNNTADSQKTVKEAGKVTNALTVTLKDGTTVSFDGSQAKAITSILEANKAYHITGTDSGDAYSIYIS